MEEKKEERGRVNGIVGGRKDKVKVVRGEIYKI